MKEIYVVTLAHARADERGGSSGGQPGDQTANKEHTRGELLFQDWYVSGSGWDCCMRAKPEKIRKQMSEDACRAVRNTKIGYSQGNRYSLYDVAKPHGFDCGKVDKPVDCDCSSLMTVCANYAGLPIAKDTSTANMQVRYTATKEFKVKSTVPCGHVKAIRQAMDRLGMAELVSSKPCRERDVVLALVAQRLIEPCSKLAMSLRFRLSTVA